MPLLEGISALSRAHAFGNLRTGMLPDSVRQWTEMNVSLLAFGLRGAQDVAANLERAGTLRQAIADGQLSPEFLGLLADSIGVNPQAIGQRLAERKAGNPPVAFDPSKVAEFIGQEADVSFSTGPRKPTKSLEAKIRTAVAEARTKAGTIDPEALKRTGRFWLSLHGVDGVQQLPKLRSNSLEDLVEEAADIHPGLSYFHLGQNNEADVSVIRDDHGSSYIKIKDGKVWVDTSEAGGDNTYGGGKHVNRVKASMATAVYQIAQAYAKNNGLQFTIDPNGTSNIADFRRWPQLLSSAIRMGDTEHIDGAKDVAGWKDGDHEHNAGLLALHEYEYVRHFFPEIDGLHLSGDSSTIVNDAGAPVPQSTLADLLAGERHPSRLGIGEATLRRAIVTGQTATEGRMESESETSGRPSGERRVHPGTIENFVPDSGSSAEGIDPPKHALDGISYSIGSDPSSDPDPSNQSHPQQYDEEGRVVPGIGGKQEIPRGSEEEIGRRIREALSRRQGGDRQEHVGSGSESFVLPFAETEVLKEIKSSGVLRFTPEGKYQYDLSMEAAEEKARVINALGGMKTRAIAWENRILIIQERGTPISETDYLSIELPFGIEPSRRHRCGVHPGAVVPAVFQQNVKRPAPAPHNPRLRIHHPSRSHETSRRLARPVSFPAFAPAGGVVHLKGIRLHGEPLRGTSGPDPDGHRPGADGGFHVRGSEDADDLSDQLLPHERT